MDKKIKVLTLSDHPLSPSGVGTQTRYVIEALLNTGRYEVISLGGAIGHHDYKPQKTDVYGDDWIIYPVDGYGGQDDIRAILRNQKPDIVMGNCFNRLVCYPCDVPHSAMTYFGGENNCRLVLLFWLFNLEILK